LQVADQNAAMAAAPNPEQAAQQQRNDYYSSMLMAERLAQMAGGGGGASGGTGGGAPRPSSYTTLDGGFSYDSSGLPAGYGATITGTPGTGAYQGMSDWMAGLGGTYSGSGGQSTYYPADGVMVDGGSGGVGGN
jgi:hypothetical protein